MRHSSSLRALAGVSGAVVSMVGCATKPPVTVAKTQPVVTAPATYSTCVGLSHGGLPLVAHQIGSGPLRVYLVGGIHGDEPEGKAGITEVRSCFSTGELAGLVTLRLLEDMNPDGAAAHTRCNAAGVDLNRNWPAKNFRASAGMRPRGTARTGVIVTGAGASPLSEPESGAAHADILAFDPHLIVVLHSSHQGPYVNFDGPPTAKSLAALFGSAAALSEGGGSEPGSTGDRWRIVADMGYPTPGSMGSYFGRDIGIPILTIEFDRGHPSASARSALDAGMRAIVRDRNLAPSPLSTLRKDDPDPQVAASRPVV